MYQNLKMTDFLLLHSKGTQRDGRMTSASDGHTLLTTRWEGSLVHL